jgi:hypothetical protein
MAGITESLRSEIVESQKARIDLMKWKIILLAAIAVVGLGLDVGKKGLPVVLAMIPLVGAYVDLLCVHNSLRILVIAAHLRKDDGQAGDYEKFCENHRRAFLLESLALFGTTLLASLLVFYVSFNPSAAGLEASQMPNGVKSTLQAGALLGTLVSGGTLAFKTHYEARLNAPE